MFPLKQKDEGCFGVTTKQRNRKWRRFYNERYPTIPLEGLFLLKEGLPLGTRSTIHNSILKIKSHNGSKKKHLTVEF